MRYLYSYVFLCSLSFIYFTAFYQFIDPIYFSDLINYQIYLDYVQDTTYWKGTFTRSLVYWGEPGYYFIVTYLSRFLPDVIFWHIMTLCIFTILLYRRLLGNISTMSAILFSLFFIFCHFTFSSLFLGNFRQLLAYTIIAFLSPHFIFDFRARRGDWWKLSVCLALMVHTLAVAILLLFVMGRNKRLFQNPIIVVMACMSVLLFYDKIIYYLFTREGFYINYLTSSQFLLLIFPLSLLNVLNLIYGSKKFSVSGLYVFIIFLFMLFFTVTRSGSEVFNRVYPCILPFLLVQQAMYFEKYVLVKQVWRLILSGAPVYTLLYWSSRVVL